MFGLESKNGEELKCKTNEQKGAVIYNGSKVECTVDDLLKWVVQKFAGKNCKSFHRCQHGTSQKRKRIKLI